MNSALYIFLFVCGLAIVVLWHLTAKKVRGSRKRRQNQLTRITRADTGEFIELRTGDSITIGDGDFLLDTSGRRMVPHTMVKVSFGGLEYRMPVPEDIMAYAALGSHEEAAKEIARRLTGEEPEQWGHTQ